MAMSLMCSFDPLCNGDSVVYKQTLVVDFCRLHSQRRRRFFLPYTKNIGQFVQKKLESPHSRSQI